MITKHLTYFGKPATHVCDGICTKAWGVNRRPTIPPRAECDASENPDDYAYLADDELGDAPIDPGTYEGGGYAKPIDAQGPEDVNKWCYRECERSWMGDPDAEPRLPDFSARLYNISRLYRRGPANG